uniref:Uncharacterized protein n=1 Tax=Anguilla anguilla TaxID=7936 RepID=A0A0E9URB1_ANGAN
MVPRLPTSALHPAPLPLGQSTGPINCKLSHTWTRAGEGGVRPLQQSPLPNSGL